MLRLDIVTIFPAMYDGPLTESIIKRAQDESHVTINFIDPREFTTDRHRTVDDKPYGGGAGMLMKAEPICKAVDSVRTEESTVILLTPRGGLFNQATARELALTSHIIMICGHYEGVDQRVTDAVVDLELSIGDFVLTNGNLAAMCVIDAVVRLMPGVLGSEESVEEESFNGSLLEYPQYTRPAEYEGMSVPEVLVSGNHKDIAAWRLNESIEQTKRVRPDLYKTYLENKDGVNDQ